jgi:N-acetylmuramic acid 6-phosphate etherase
MNKFKLYSKLPTEQINKNTFNIDRLTLTEILKKLNEEDRKVPVAVSKEIKNIAKASQLLSKVFLDNKKIFFMGAGTSGRLGVLEAAELPPTYGVSSKQFIAVMAGGKTAVFLSKEGAEDIYQDGYNEINKRGKEGDLLIGIAASGITPYVKGGIDSAKKKKMKVIFITCNRKYTPEKANVVIAVNVGPEPVNGSTRMKSGTATKLVLNMLTTSAMIISGKVYHNWMVDLKNTSLKLTMRAQRICQQITDLPLNKVKRLLKLTDYNLKVAIIMAKKNISKKDALKLLQKHKGFLKDILDD